jgi:hypothetical protein
MSFESIDYEAYAHAHGLDRPSSEVAAQQTTRDGHPRAVPFGYPPLAGASKNAISSDEDMNGSFEEVIVAKSESGEPRL